MAGPDPIFGIHAQALRLQRQRMDVLANNLANADTPHFQARDLDFANALKASLQVQPTSAPEPVSTTAGHIPIESTLTSHAAALRYRVALQPSVDGNTVDAQVEQAQFADAALHYQASLSFADGRLRSLMTALTGQ